MESCFTYQKPSSSAMLVTFSIEDIDLDDVKELITELEAFNTLYISRNHHPHPFGHKETREEMEARLHFNIHDWHIVAGVFDNTTKTGFSSVLIVNKKNYHFAYVLEMKGYQLTDSIYGPWAINTDEGLFSDEEILDIFGIRQAAKPVPQPQPKVEPVPVFSFQPNKKRDIPNLDKKAVTPSPKSHPSQPSELDSYEPEFAAKEEPEEEDDTYVAPKLDIPKFVASSSKKPKNLDGFFDAKPKPIQKETPKAEKHEMAETPPSFAPTNNKKPKNLNDTRNVWQSRPRLTLGQDRDSPNSRQLLFSWTDEYVLSLFEGAKKYLSRFDSLQILDQCCFTPEVPENGGQWKKHFKNFDIEEWYLLAINVNAYNHVTSALLSLKEVPTLCCILTSKGFVPAISFIGGAAGRPWVGFEELLERQTPPDEPEPVIDEEPKLAAPLEVVEEEPDEEEATPEEIVLKPVRRVFVSQQFLKDEERFIDKYHSQAVEDFQKTIMGLITMTDEELEAYLKGHDSKSISVSHGVTILKMQFGTSREYAASRLFYCRGYDVKRRMNSSDFLLLGLSDQGEHEEQTKVAALVGRMFSESDLVLYQRLLPEAKNADLDQLAYMSSAQFGYLDQARSSMPMAFLGSAGTGKTLLSLQHYLSLLNEDNRVLYLTYQKALCDEVRKTLRELSADHIDAMTYRDLCFSLFGDDAKAMRTKKRYRKWFLEYVNKTGAVQSKLRLVGPTVEDQFMICYVFYRGIIDGSRHDWEKRRGRIISKERFLQEVSDEEGLSQEAKEVVYDVALAYEKHLQRREGTTDNKLAYRILSLGKSAQHYDAIVIDEFQDLSEMQFMAVVSLLKPTYPLPLFIYGDENQAINPTIFNFSDANNILYEMFHNKVRFSKTQLSDSYRSGPNLVHYINDVNAVKRRAIGARSQLEEVEVSLREDEEDLFATLVEGKGNLEKLVSICASSDKDVVFIFPNALRRESAIQQLSSIDPTFVESMFLSVEETKGREWDSAVLVDFFSSSKELFDAMIGEDQAGKHSTVHRMLFNRFYVALTRARNRIVVYESDVSNIIREKLLSGLTKLTEVEQLRSYFKGDVSQKEWKEFGERLLRARKYGDAYRAFSKSDDEESKKKAAIAWRYLQHEQGNLTYVEARDFFLSRLDYSSLCDLYDEMGHTDHLQYLRLCQENNPDLRYLSEAFNHLEPSLSPLEKQVFFCLLARKMNRYINALRRKLLRKE